MMMAEENMLSGLFDLMMGMIYLIIAVIDAVGHIAIEIARNWLRKR